MPTTRRRLLTATAAGAAAAVAGCSTTEPSGHPLREWVPGPEAIPGEGPYVTRSLDYDALRAVDTLDVDEVDTTVERRRETVGLDRASVRSGSVLGPETYRYRGEFDPESVAAATGFEETGERDGYRLLAGDGGAAAVDEERVVLARAGGSDGPGPATVVDRVLDTGDGEREPYAVADGDYDALLGRVEDGDFVLAATYGGSPPVGGLAGLGYDVRYGEETTDVRVAYLFDDEASASVEAVGPVARSFQASFSEPEYEVDGRAVVGTTSSPTAALLGEADEDPTPAASFDFDYEAPDGGGRGRLTVTHTGGDEFDADNTATLSVRVDGEVRRTFDLPVVAGDSLDLRVDPGVEARVVWEGPDGAGLTVVAQSRVPA